MRQYRVVMITTKDRLRPLQDLLLEYGYAYSVAELAKPASTPEIKPTNGDAQLKPESQKPKPRAFGAWVEGDRSQFITDLLGKHGDPLHYKEIGAQMVNAGLIGVVDSVSPILTHLKRQGAVQHVKRGWYTLP